MKKLIMLAAVSAVTLVACKKDDDDNNDKSNAELIVGSWESTSYLEVEKDANGNILDTVDYFTGNEIGATFTAQGAVTIDYDGFPLAGTYAVSGNNLNLYIFGDTAVYQLTTLTATNMNWSGGYVEDSLAYDLTASFVKQ